MDRVRSHHGVGQEIHSLRTLVRRHILDRDALKDAGFRFLYFIDAHELKAYIHGVSKDFVEGFELGPEEALRASGEWPHMLAELRLKCELAIRWVLFDQPCPVVVLPPHGVEIEEEIAYQRHRELVRDLGLLKDAKEQLRELRRGRFAGQLLSQLASQALRGNDKSKTDLMEYLLRAAPALAVMLKIVPDEVDSIQSRIQKLVTRSNLSTLRTVNWAEYGLNDEEAEIIRRVGLDEGRVAHWQQRLEDSRNNSVRSNRLDAEAIAYVEGLNESLSRHGIRARGVLVTHTATLIQATRHPPPLRARPHGTDDPIRHIRLLVWDDSSTADSPPADGHIDDPLGRAAESLELALEVYYGQIDARGGNPFNLPMREAGALMDAWTAFETARSTLKLGRRGQISRDLEKTQWPGESEIETLLQWLRSERDLESLVAERLSSLVNTFGREVLTASGLKDLQVFVRFSPGEMGHHTMVLPVADRFLGPIELPEQRAVKSVGRPTRNVFPHDMAAIGEGSPQSYLTLALLHAAKGSLPLAEVYAKAATDSADFLKHPALGAESRLLNAQLHRMTAARANAKSRVPAESRARLDNALRFLEESARFRHSPRADLERAAINLERLVHNLDS
ncbi:MAG TPA: hypothetical protein VFP68_16600, partial [Burkholderiaceae bacterium]|nr:hypothetical protein [Burkholderiaceae bacterium]